MRNYIFDFDQQIMMDLNLSLEECLLLDYLTKFFDSGYAVTKYIERRKYCWITYKKMLEDLPILRKKERQTRRVLVSLEQKGLIKRHLENKNRLYIYVNQELLFYGYDGNEGLTNEDIKDLNDLPAGQDSPPIVKYYKNKIKILSRNARVKDLDKFDFLLKLKQKLKPLISEISFDICMKNAEVISISDNLIILSVSAPNILKDRPGNVFENAVIEVINELTSEEGGSKFLADSSL